MRALGDRRVLGSSLRDLIGGRWAVSWIAYAINAPFNLAAIASNAGTSLAGASWWQWGLVSIIGYAGFGAVLLLAHLSFLNQRRSTSVPISAVISLGALAGGVRGAIVGSAAQMWGLAPESASLVLTRIGTGAILGAVLLPISALVLAVIATYRQQRSALIGDSRRLRVETLRALGSTREIHEALVQSVQADLAEVERTRDPAVARDVSRRIWEESPAEIAEPRLHWMSALRASVQHNPFATLPVVTIWTLSAVGTLTAAIGGPRALAQILSSITAIGIVFWIGRRLVRAHPRHSTAIFIIAMTVLVLLTGPAASWLFDPRQWPAGAGLIVINTIWLPLLTIAIGFVIAAVRSGERVLADLRAQVDDESITALAMHDERERMRRELATRLHGSVQSRLLLESLSPSESGLAGNLLARLADIPAAEVAIPLAEHVSTVADPWRALVEVEVSFDPPHAAELTVPAGGALARVVEEGIANAFRHGHATRVGIRIVDGGDHVHVSITDDGIGVGAAPGRGLGTSLLDALAPDSWALESLAGGTELRVSLTYRT